MLPGSLWGERSFDTFKARRTLVVRFRLMGLYFVSLEMQKTEQGAFRAFALADVKVSVDFGTAYRSGAG